MTESLESAIRIEGNRRIRVRKPRKKQTSTSNDRPIPPWEAEADRLPALVQRTADPETLAQITRSVTTIQEAIEALDEAGKAATEYTKYRRLIPNALTCTVIRPALMAAERLVDGTLGAPSRFAPRSLLYPSERILVIRGSLRIDIFTKQPRRSTCEGLIRAFQARELDVEGFLAWFREQTMGLLGPQLDPYIAEVLLGMRVSGGEVLVRGDMQNLAGLDEQKLLAVITGRAKKLRRRDQNGARDLVRILAPGEQKANGTCDAMKLVVDRMWPGSDGDEDDGVRPSQPYVEVACKAPDVAYLGEMGELFASTEASERTLAAGIIRAGNRELLERIGRKAGLTREESRFLYRRALGKVTKRDDERRWRAINAKMPGIQEALAGFRFGQIL